ncbi:MAG: hypothetical protein LUO79_01680 [Methanomassiliicoccales archaeon]|nr:hypothetical protein [Methanomassiliicoccales archaeon]
MRSARIGTSTVQVLGVLKGLVSESSKVEEAVSAWSPDAVGMSVSAEELGALKVKEDYSLYEMSTLEEVYSVYMESFGPISLPTPAYVRALDLCQERGIPIEAVDLSDADFTEAYCQLIGATEMVREAFFTRSIGRKKFDISSPESFALDWDRRLNKAKGFRQLEMEREEHMAQRIFELADKHSIILAVIEYERSDRVADLLEEKEKVRTAGTA